MINILISVYQTRDIYYSSQPNIILHLSLILLYFTLHYLNGEIIIIRYNFLFLFFKYHIIALTLLWSTYSCFFLSLNILFQNYFTYSKILLVISKVRAWIKVSRMKEIISSLHLLSIFEWFFQYNDWKDIKFYKLHFLCVIFGRLRLWRSCSSWSILKGPSLALIIIILILNIIFHFATINIRWYTCFAQYCTTAII